ncbi:MAG: response regulator [Candidatus Kerfeldbacteria bacterium CG08_land_8_20_14_0_20_40_16]|uniref:Response regulator n=1 Tax=Candidatus Kerfeldbacteria bacterium CG08_land_8_20_14_0_20_40_16 TaxID=2014244 RepID=A0A2H0YV77_9BACT|nr:MAG: response regulator [Candidatus Kerfeldbacteria bacterium CG08_land_8_20_14_0_20_40_16]
MPKILLIEDDKDQILMYQTKFELSGYDFIAAEDGPKGLELAEKENPDMILIDLLMDKMGGIEVLEHLKENPKTKNIPAVIVTNLDKHELAEKAMALGALDFIVKSKIPLREMMARIEAHFKK